ncbi:MAG: hypothetical protein GF341_06000 [candidate division Zixibacteria bacterium]|nr:hypothetical protein [candidate division Zixibacteria bacterium]
MRRLLTSGIALLLILTLGASLADAQPGRRRRPVAPKEPPPPGLWQKSAIGGALGPWLSDGFGEDIETETYRLSASSTAFHLEFSYMPHLTGPLNLDINVGAVSRGDIRITQTTGNVGIDGFGSATLYPLGLGIAWFPLAKSINTTFQPFLRAGGSLIVGTETVDAVVYDQFGGFIGTSSESRVEAGYYGGAGAFLVLGRQFALTGNVKYQYAEFSEELFGVTDYSGVQILIGAVYLYR